MSACQALVESKTMTDHDSSVRQEKKSLARNTVGECRWMRPRGDIRTGHKRRVGNCTSPSSEQPGDRSGDMR